MYARISLSSLLLFLVCLRFWIVFLLCLFAWLSVILLFGEHCLVFWLWPSPVVLYLCLCLHQTFYSESTLPIPDFGVLISDAPWLFQCEERNRSFCNFGRFSQIWQTFPAVKNTYLTSEVCVCFTVWSAISEEGDSLEWLVSLFQTPWIPGIFHFSLNRINYGNGCLTERKTM